MKYIKYLIVLFIDAGICKITFSFIKANLLVRVISEIFLCSVVVNIVFIIVFYRTPEFSKFKAVVKNVIYILKNKIRRGN